MNTNSMFGSKLAAWISAMALVAVLAGGAAVAVAQTAEAPAAPAADAAPMPADATAPADASAAPAGPPAAAAPVSVDNPYGIEHMLETGDFVNRSTFIILVIMSAGSWYITIMRLIDQTILIRQAAAAQKSFWSAGSIKDGLAKLDANSAFRAIVSDGMKAAEHHDG